MLQTRTTLESVTKAVARTSTAPLTVEVSNDIFGTIKVLVSKMVSAFGPAESATHVYRDSLIMMVSASVREVLAAVVDKLCESLHNFMLPLCTARVAVVDWCLPACDGTSFESLIGIASFLLVTFKPDGNLAACATCPCSSTLRFLATAAQLMLEAGAKSILAGTGVLGLDDAKKFLTAVGDLVEGNADIAGVAAAGLDEVPLPIRLCSELCLKARKARSISLLNIWCGREDKTLS
jgi:hypothetical protein